MFRYFMNPYKPIIGNFYNNSDEYVAPPKQATVDYVDLMKSSNYRNNFKLKFDKSLKGMTTHHMLVHTNDTYNYELFNGWNFTEFHYLEMFLYKPETNKLFETNSYKLYEDEIDMITVRSASSIFRHKARNVTKSILGIDIEKQDIVEKRLSWSKNLNIDADYKVPKKNSAY